MGGGGVDFFPQEKRIPDIGNGKIGIKVDIVFMPLLKNVVKIIQFRLWTILTNLEFNLI